MVSEETELDLRAQGLSVIRGGSIPDGAAWIVCSCGKRWVLKSNHPGNLLALVDHAQGCKKAALVRGEGS